MPAIPRPASRDCVYIHTYQTQQSPRNLASRADNHNFFENSIKITSKWTENKIFSTKTLPLDQYLLFHLKFNFDSRTNENKSQRRLKVYRCLVRKFEVRRGKGSAKTHLAIIDALVVCIDVGSHWADSRSIRPLGGALRWNCERTSRVARIDRKFGRPVGFSREYKTVLVREYVPLMKNKTESF